MTDNVDKEEAADVAPDPQSPGEEEPNSPSSDSEDTPQSPSAEETAPLEEGAPSKPKKKRRGLFRRLIDWWRSKGAASSSGASESGISEQTVAPASQSPKELAVLIAKKERELARAQKEERVHEDHAQSLKDQLDEHSSELERVRQWVTGLQRSYYWKVQQRMAHNRDRVKADLARFEAEVDALDLPERDVLVTERKRFHKALTITLLSTSLPTALWLALPWLMSFVPPEWLSDFLVSPWFTVVAVLVGGIAIGVLTLIRRALGPSKLKIGRIVRILLLLILPFVVVGLFTNNLDWIRDFLVPLSQRLWLEVLLAALITFVFSLIVLLSVFYSKWSTFRRDVLEKFTSLENVARGYVQSKEEIRRLDNLYEQLGEWLELLAHSLYRPWKIDASWMTNQEFDLASQSFPFSLRVAQAVDSENARLANLERLIRERLMIQGWRSEAFEDMLAGIADNLGRDSEDISSDVLDADLPHQSNNSRKLVTQFLRVSAARSRGTTADGPDSHGPDSGVFTDDYLVSVARQRLGMLIEQTQSEVLAAARPDVSPLGTDPLQHIKADAVGFESADQVENWDQFLKDALGYTGSLQPPLSAITFGDEGVIARGHESTRSFMLVPDRLASHFMDADGSRVTVVPLRSPLSATPAELVVRFDFSGPLPFSHVRLVEGLPEGEESASTQPAE